MLADWKSWGSGLRDGHYFYLVGSPRLGLFLSVLPPQGLFQPIFAKCNSCNFFWATLMLMICTPLVPGTKIIDGFARLFKDYPVTKEWVIKLGEKDLAHKLAPLGMNKKNASNIFNAAKHLRSLRRDHRDNRELRTFWMGLEPRLLSGEVHRKAQGVPCNIHMCRIF
jgi:hypothetical protein